MSLAASAAPTARDRALLKTAAAAACSVPETGITHYAVTSTRDYRRRLADSSSGSRLIGIFDHSASSASSTSSSGDNTAATRGEKSALAAALAAGRAVAKTAAAAFPSPSRFLASYTWAVAFDVVTSLGATNFTSVAGLQAALVASLAGPAFEAALAAALDATVAVESVGGTPTTLQPTPRPSAGPVPSPSPVPTPLPTPQPAVTKVVVVSASWLSSVGAILGGAFIGAVVLTVCIRVGRRKQRQFRYKYHVDER
jgi:hypothetical protein